MVYTHDKKGTKTMFRTTYYVEAESYHFGYMSRVIYNFHKGKWQVKISKHCLTESVDEAKKVANVRDKTRIVTFEEYTG